MNKPSPKCRAGFTLIELLVVITVICMIVGMLLPALSAAMQKSRLIQCASNERQICLALYNYSAEWKGRYPQNLSSGAGSYWYDADRIGVYLKTASATTPGGPVYTCPNDDINARLSYAMNVWASCKIDNAWMTHTPPTGSMWQSGHMPISRLILIAEGYSWSGNAANWYCKTLIGYAGATAGEKFGGGAGIAPPQTMGRFGLVTSELCYMRHRPNRSPYTYTQPHGILNLAYGDGHVETKTDRDLVTPSGNSSGDSLWCATDVIGP